MARARTIALTIIVFLAVAFAVKARVLSGTYQSWRGWVRSEAKFDPTMYDGHVVFLVVAFFGAWLVARGRRDRGGAGVLVRTADELGIRSRALPAFLFAGVATLPMLAIGFLAGGQPVFRSSLLLAAVLAPLAEELFFRGWAFGRLVRGGKMGFWPAAIITGVVFGLMHISARHYAGLSFTTNDAMTFLITGVGGVFFAWLYVRWNWNLWVPIALHAGMNLWWDVFSESGIGGLQANVARALTITAAVVLTMYRQRIPFLRDREPA